MVPHSQDNILCPQPLKKESRPYGRSDSQDLYDVNTLFEAQSHPSRADIICRSTDQKEAHH